MRIFAVIFLLVVPFFLRAQEHSLTPPVKQIEVVGDTIIPSKAFFIGEVHALFEGGAFESELIRTLHKKYGISDVVMEWGKSEAYQFNEYFRNGDTAILHYYGREQRIMDLIKKWQLLYKECNLILHGVDFERTTYVTAVLSILNRSGQARSTELYKYLSGLADHLDDMDDSKAGKKVNVKNLATAQNIFMAEKSKLQQMLPTGYTTVEEIFENPALEKNFNKRDEAMAVNLQNLKTGSNGFVCIMGIGHTTFHKNSLIKRYTDSNPHNPATLVSMVCKNCYTSSYVRNSVVPMVADYEGKNGDYMLGVFDNYYKPGYYSLVNQHEFKGLPGGYNAIPTYYVLFKDQPKW